MSRLTHSALRHAALWSTLACVLGAYSCRGTHTPTQPSPPCTVTVDPASRELPRDGGSGTVSVTTSAPTCAWTTTSSAAWVTIVEGASGTGSGTVTYSAGANPSTDARTATLTVEGASHTVSQPGQAPAPPPTCHYVLEPREASFTSAGGDGRATVTAEAGCGWTATSNASWLVLTSGGPGSGSGTVAYTVERNAETTSRTARITVAGQSLTVTQSGVTAFCEYRVSPVQFSPCMPAGTLTTNVSTGASCRWTVSTSVPWLTVTSGGSHRGPGEIKVTFSANYDAPREGVVMVRWPTPTAGQNVRVSQAGCVYAVTKTAIDFTASGGTGSFDVLQQSNPTICGGATQDQCLWTATADVPWITITSSMPRSGDNPVFFTVAANGGTAVRTGTIKVRDQVVRITQQP